MTVQTLLMDCMIVLGCPAEMLSMLSSSLGLCLAPWGPVQVVLTEVNLDGFQGLCKLLIHCDEAGLLSQLRSWLHRRQLVI